MTGYETVTYQSLDKVRVLLTGDEGVGVSSLAKRLFNDGDARRSDNPGYDKKTILVDGTPTTLAVLWGPGFPPQLWAESKDDDAVKIHAVVVCFDVSQPATLENARTKWLPKAAKRFPRAQLLLAGLKVDKRDAAASDSAAGAAGEETKGEGGPQCISRDDALAVARSVGVVYEEAESKTGAGVEKLFELVVRTCNGAASRTQTRYGSSGGGSSSGSGSGAGAAAAKAPLKRTDSDDGESSGSCIVS